MRTTTKSPTGRPTASPAPPPEAGGAPAAGTHCWPVHRHSRSCEYAGLQLDPSHHQKPSGEKRPGGTTGTGVIDCGVGGGTGGTGGGGTAGSGGPGGPGVSG